MKSHRALREPITTIEIPFGRNPYGYRINVGHKLIAPLFHEWQLANGLNPRFPPGDENRLRFEGFVLEAIATYQQNSEDYLKYELECLKQQNKKVSLGKD